MKILLIDDTIELRELMSYQLKKQFPQAQVHTAQDGAEALKILSAISFDLIVTDCNMPVMDGIEFVKNARASGVTAPIFMWSGEVAPKVEGIGINGFYHKSDTAGLFNAMKAVAA